jgi:sugar-specific transcriptional regulator TrmB
LSLERIIKTLEGFGLKRADAEVYIYLAKRGPQKREDIANALKTSKKQLYLALITLQNKGLVTGSPEHPALFLALAFEEALELIVKVNIEQARVIKETKEELLSSWRRMTKQDHT